MLTILGALLALWHHFWAQLRHLGITFGAFWMHFSSQKTNWGAKGAPRGASTKILSPIWVPFGGNFWCVFVFLVQKSVYLAHAAFFLNFWGALSAFGDGLICNPYTYMQSKHTFQFLHSFLKKWHPKESNMGLFWHHFLLNIWFFIGKKRLQKMLQKKVFC